MFHRTQVAFGDLLENGDRLPIDSFLLSGLIHFATDGETFGHHHRFGEMALLVPDRIATSARAPYVMRAGHHPELRL